MSDAADAGIESLLRGATRRLRVERARLVFARACLVLLAGLPLLLLWHALGMPVPPIAVWVLALLAPLAALIASAGSVTRGEAAEWVDRQLDGASTFGTLLEYAQDSRPSAARLRDSARVRAPECSRRLARLPHSRSLARPLLWTGLALLVATAALSLTEGRLSPRGTASPVAKQADAADGPRVTRPRSDPQASGTTADRGTGGDPAETADITETAELDALGAPRPGTAQVVAAEGQVLTPGEGDSSSGASPGREAGSGLDRGGADLPAPSDAQLAVQLRELLGAAAAPDRRARGDREGRYDDAGGGASEGAAAGSPQRAAAALAPSTHASAGLDPATAAFVRAYSATAAP